jgi:hypothetical protein
MDRIFQIPGPFREFDVADLYGVGAFACLIRATNRGIRFSDRRQTFM